MWSRKNPCGFRLTHAPQLLQWSGSLKAFSDPIHIIREWKVANKRRQKFRVSPLLLPRGSVRTWLLVKQQRLHTPRAFWRVEGALVAIDRDVCTCVSCSAFMLCYYSGHVFNSLAARLYRTEHQMATNQLRKQGSYLPLSEAALQAICVPRLW